MLISRVSCPKYQRRVRTVARTLSGGFWLTSSASARDFEIGSLWRHPVDEPRLQRFFGGEEPSGQRHLRAECGATEKLHQPPVARGAESARCLRHLKFGTPLAVGCDWQFRS